MSQRERSTPGSDVHLCRWLICHAARRAPEPLKQRLEEEWLADLDERAAPMSRLRFAAGCCWATGIITLDHQPAPVAATSAIGDEKLVSAYAPHDTGYLSGRSGTLIIVASLHAIVLYALATAVTHIHVGHTDPLQNTPVNEPHRDLVPPTVPQPQIGRTVIEVGRPEFSALPQSDASAEVTTTNVDPGPPTSPAPPLPSRTPTQVQGGPGPGFPNPDDFYPMAARHLEEQGVATVEVLRRSEGPAHVGTENAAGHGECKA